MADYVDTKVSNLVINNLTQEKYDELLASGQINPDELYCTPDSRASAVLFEAKWFDHIVDDMSWLRADNFTWHSGDVYKSAYEHLASEYEAETTLGQQTDTIDGITIYYRLAEDGHKIVPADREPDVQTLYEKTGVAWYYVLDQENKQFKLPRTKFGFTGLRDAVGGYVTPGLPNITGEASMYLANVGSLGVNVATGAFGLAVPEKLPTATKTGTESTSVNTRFNFNANRSSSVYGNGNTVQPKATQMYLYFYVGNFTKSALEQTAGITSEQLNAKADKTELETQLASKANLAIFDAIYPVGSIYIGTQSTCPMAVAIPGSTWQLVSAGRALWTGNGSNGNTTIAAGLPNLTGNAQYSANGSTSAYFGAWVNLSGVFTADSTGSTAGLGGGNAHSNAKRLLFKASTSNSIYGQSTTVQPPAYVVNVWRRTA